MGETDLARFTNIDFTYTIAKLAAEIDAKLTKLGEQIGIADVQIAATCIHFDLILISRNIKHYKRLTNLKVKKY